MANELKNYVEKFILNPNRNSKLDDIDDDDATVATVSERIQGTDGNEGAGISSSKLRKKNATLLSERDPRYKSKKILRKSFKSLNDVETSYDPSYLNHLILDEPPETNSIDSSDGSFDDEEDNSQEDKSMSTDEDNSSEEEITDSESSLIEDSVQEEKPQTKTLYTEDSDFAEKSISVKNQIALYDSLFELRIGLQKVLTSTNQLPQYDKYNLFLKEDNGLYKKHLHAARTATKKLLSSFVELHESLLLKNPEAKYVVTEESNPKQESDEEVLSSEDEEKEEKKVSVESPKEKKRKLEIDQTLNKRHKAFETFRDSTLLKWHEKVKLLFGHKDRDKFSAFDISPVQQMANLLANKEQLIKRTQLVGISRGNTFRILGKEESPEKATADEHDPEIFDDSDFYSRMLEEVLKSKMSLSEDMTDISRRWIEIQNLRKKAKKKVDTKASKGRKIRYDVMSKLQQYFAPCKPPSMDDSATNMLFGSIFGSTINS